MKSVELEQLLSVNDMFYSGFKQKVSRKLYLSVSLFYVDYFARINKTLFSNFT